MSATLSIPASQLVDIIPSVIGGGGNGLVLNGVCLTPNTRVPIGQALSFPTQLSVSNFFGPTSAEAAFASTYFNSYNNSSIKPGALIFYQYNQAPVSAYMRGGQISGLTLSQLQAISGVLTVTIDGTSHTSSNISLSGATSFSQAAEIITTALGTTGAQQAAFTASQGWTATGTASGTSLTLSSVSGLISIGDTITGTGITGTVTILSQQSGTTGGAGVYTTSASTTASASSITGTSNVLNVTATTSGTIAVGQQLEGTSVGAGTYVTGLLTGTGGVGTYTVSTVEHVASEAMTTVMPTVTYDSVSGSFVVSSGTTGAGSTMSYGSGTIAGGLYLTQATGAVLSQGAVAQTPAGAMNAFVQLTQNWASFTTLVDPDAFGSTGNTLKQAFAAWANGQNNQYCYVAWDTDITPTESTQATTSLGYLLKQSGSNGTLVIYDPQNIGMAAFAMGYAASLNFDATNGRTTLAFRGAAGLTPYVTNATIAQNLIANGYNFYGNYATANQSFQEFQPGSVTGTFLWADTYFNQIWLNAALQLAFMELLQAMNSIPYNPTGYAAMASAALDPITAAVNFGAIQQNVPLSYAQKVEVNTAAGLTIDPILSTRGWFLQINPATAQVRAQRGSPPCTLWYMDGGSVQKIVLNSVVVL